MLILGIETTCDETAAAVVRDGTVVLSSVVASQVGLHEKFGGVVPEVAARAHLELLDGIVAEALARAGIGEPAKQLDAVAVANGPGLIGCLLVGTAAAKGYAFGWSKPLVGVNHVQAHLYSVVLGEDGGDMRKTKDERQKTQDEGQKTKDERQKTKDERRATVGVSTDESGGRAGVGEGEEIENQKSEIINPVPVSFPAIGLVMSGGHSSLYFVESFHELKRIGQTQDDAVGEAFDKVAAILQLGYPGGPLIDALARRGNPAGVKLPMSHLEKDSLNFSFSGLKTAVLYHVNGKKGQERDASALSEEQKADVAASFQRTAAAMLVEKLRRAAGRYPARSLVIGGGVSANSEIRRAVVELGRELRLPVFIPEMRFCTDNAAMIAGMGYEMLRAGRAADLDLAAVATV